MTLFTIKISHTTCATTVYVVHTVYIVCTLYIAVVAMPAVRPATTPFCSPIFFLKVILCKKAHRQASWLTYTVQSLETNTLLAYLMQKDKCDGTVIFLAGCCTLLSNQVVRVGPPWPRSFLLPIGLLYFIWYWDIVLHTKLVLNIIFKIHYCIELTISGLISFVS